MTFTEALNGFHDKWAHVGKAVGKFAWWMLNIALGFALSAGFFLGQWKTKFEVQETQQAEIRGMISPLAERVTRLEEAGKDNTKLLRGIKELLEQRASVPQPKNSAPVRK